MYVCVCVCVCVCMYVMKIYTVFALGEKVSWEHGWCIIFNILKFSTELVLSLITDPY